MAKIIVPSVTIFDDTYEIDCEGNKKVIDFLIENNVNGILVSGSTGEFACISKKQRKELIKLYADYALGRTELYAGTGGLSVEDSAELSNYALEAGFDAVLLIGPYYYASNEDQLFDYYNELTHQVKGDVYIYNYPARTGHCVTLSLIERLTEANPNIKGMKDSNSDPSNCSNILSRMSGRDFKMYSGFDNQFLFNLSAGGAGSMGALANIAPEIWSAQVEAYNQGDFENTLKIAKIIHDMMPLYSLDSNPSLLLKHLMVYRGIDVNTTTQKPYHKINHATVEEGEKILTRALECFNSITS